MSDTGEELSVGAQRLLECVRLIANPAALYAEASDSLRRHLNQALFEYFYIDDDDSVSVNGSVLRPPFDEISETHNALMLKTTLDFRDTKNPVLADGANGLHYLIRPVKGSSKTVVVELLLLNSNSQITTKRLQNVRLAAISEQRTQVEGPLPRKMVQLRGAQLAELIAAYRQGATVKELGKQFGVHRTTVTTLLLRHGVELRPVGMSPEEISESCQLYQQGWSLAKLGEKFDASPNTVRRVLLIAGVVMRSPNQTRRQA